MLPDQQTVVAITEQSFDTQRTLNFVWDILLPGLQQGALPANITTDGELKKTLTSLEVKTPAGSAAAPQNNFSRKIVLDDNPFGARVITLNRAGNTCELTAIYDAGPREVVFGLNSWETAGNKRLVNSQLPFPVGGLPDVSSPVAGYAAWTDENTIMLFIRPVETVTSDSMAVAFNGNAVKINFLHSVARANPAKGLEKRPELTGRVV